MSREKAFAKEVAKATEIQQLHKCIQDLLFQRGLRLNSKVLNTISITSHTTNTAGIKESLPVPYAELKKTRA